MTQPADEAHIHLVKLHASLAGYGFGQTDLVGVFLTVEEAERIYFLEMFFCPKQAGGGVLAAAQHDQGAGVVKFHCRERLR